MSDFHGDIKGAPTEATLLRYKDGTYGYTISKVEGGGTEYFCSPPPGVVMPTRTFLKMNPNQSYSARVRLAVEKVNRGEIRLQDIDFGTGYIDDTCTTQQTQTPVVPAVSVGNYVV